MTLALLVVFAVTPAAMAQDEDDRVPPEVEENTTKRAQTGFKFMRMSVSARAAALGDAMTAMEAGSIAMFYNPATMAHTPDFANASVGRTQLFADINYNAASLALAPSDGRYGVIGVSFMNVDYGTFEGTIRSDNTSGYVETGNFSPNALMVGVGYAKALTDRFAVGGNIKYASQELGDAVVEAGGDDSFTYESSSQGTMAFDFGVIYKTGFRSLNFAMSAKNFSREVTYHEENFELPLLLTIGLSMDIVDLFAVDQNTHSFIVAADAYRPRDFYEALNIGAEYSFMNTLFLRAGYVYPTDEQGINAGAGVNLNVSGVQFGADYAYSSWGLLGNVSRLSLQFGF